MSLITVKEQSRPTEVRAFKAHGSVSIYDLGSQVIGLATFEPGWKWSEDVKPLAGTDSCEADHVMYVVSGRMIVVSDDKTERVEMKAGDFVTVEPGHDAWVVGDEPFVAIDFTGMRHYAEGRPAPQAPKVEAERSARM